MKNLTVILFVLLILGCDSSGKPKKPDHLISKEKMVDVLYDVSLLSSAKGVNKKILESNNVDPEAYIFKKHSIDSLQFVQSNTYYAYDSKIYEGIIKDVKARIEREKTIYEALSKQEKQVEDSLKQVALKKRNDSIYKNKKIKVSDSLKIKLSSDKENL